MSDPKPDLYDPDYAAFAWGRYRELMAWMTLAAAILVALSLFGLAWFKGPLPIHMVIGTTLGVFFSVMLAAALMGLVFLSSGTGHDETIQDYSEDADDGRAD